MIWYSTIACALIVLLNEMIYYKYKVNLFVDVILAGMRLASVISHLSQSLLVNKYVHADFGYLFYTIHYCTD